MPIVIARVLTIVSLSALLGCGGGAGATGRVDIATAFVPGDDCPSITSATAGPAQISVGGAIAVAASATDPDAADRLSYAWAPASGFANPTAPATTFTCPSPGRQKLTVTVSDNHTPTPCTTSATLTVECMGP
jgi:hypothetical protein